MTFTNYISAKPDPKKPDPSSDDQIELIVQCLLGVVYSIILTIGFVRLSPYLLTCKKKK